MDLKQEKWWDKRLEKWCLYPHLIMAPFRKVSKKQAIKNRVWGKVKTRRLRYLYDKYGYFPCECCGKAGIVGGDSFDTLDPHHIDVDRNNNTYENCFIVRRECHTFITDNNIRVTQEQGLPV